MVYERAKEVRCPASNSDKRVTTHAIVRIGFLRPAQWDRGAGECCAVDVADPARCQRRIIAALCDVDGKSARVDRGKEEWVRTEIRLARALPQVCELPP